MKEGDGWGIVSYVDASIVKEVETEMEIASAPEWLHLGCDTEVKQEQGMP